MQQGNTQDTRINVSINAFRLFHGVASYGFSTKASGYGTMPKLPKLMEAQNRFAGNNGKKRKKIKAKRD